MRPRVPLLVLVWAVLASAAAHAVPAEFPGPGEKLSRQTVGTTPQSLTEAERAKLAQAMAGPQAMPARSSLRPAPWLPPGWRPAPRATPAPRPAAATALPHDPRGEVRAALGRVTHGVARPVKAAPVTTVGTGAPGASQAKIAAKQARAAAARRGASR